MPSRDVVIQQFGSGVLLIPADSGNNFPNPGPSNLPIYALTNDGRAWRAPDTFVERSKNQDDWYTCERRSGQRPEQSGIPWRGFGSVWCAYGDIRAAVGNVRSGEFKVTGSFQSYQNGFAFRMGDWSGFANWSAGRAYVLYWSSSNGNLLTGNWE